MRLPLEIVWASGSGWGKDDSSNAVDMANQNTRDALIGAVNSLDLLQSNEAMVENASSRNTFNLTAGEYGGGTLKKRDSNIYGTSGGSTIHTKLSLKNRHVVDTVRFANSADNRDELVVVGDSAVVQFRNCVFDRTITANAPKWVIVDNGGMAVFIGCMFLGVGTGGIVIENGGAAANVQVVGSYNGTGIAFAGVTSAALGNI
tara:strand:+ start:12947 stop:13555 length:609 start_codon:yes stop_codon:yes gene_type:complete